MGYTLVVMILSAVIFIVRLTFFQEEPAQPCGVER